MALTPEQQGQFLEIFNRLEEGQRVNMAATETIQQQLKQLTAQQVELEATRARAERAEASLAGANAGIDNRILGALKPAPFSGEREQWPEFRFLSETYL